VHNEVKNTLLSGRKIQIQAARIQYNKA